MCLNTTVQWIKMLTNVTSHRLVSTIEKFNSKNIAPLVAVFVALNIADIVSTYVLIEYNGVKELNPFINYIISCGWHWLVLIKFVGIAGIMFIAYKLSSNYKFVSIATLYFINLLYVFIVGNNLAWFVLNTMR